MLRITIHQTFFSLFSIRLCLFAFLLDNFEKNPELPPIGRMSMKFKFSKVNIITTLVKSYYYYLKIYIISTISREIENLN